jgi:primosomal protein N' (replication factor Y)
MVGTQMIAKGLHFPDVTLVGVINCDATLQIPDFRAQESVFQLITQVSGRAGRGYAPGEVILQTFHPSHPTIKAAAEQDYPAFFKEESATREAFGFPPFSRIVRFIFSGVVEKLVAETTHKWNQRLQKKLPSSFFCHPPLPCGHAKIQDRWRYQCLIRGPSVTVITNLIEELDKSERLPHGVHRFCDVDPISTFF